MANMAYDPAGDKEAFASEKTTSIKVENTIIELTPAALLYIYHAINPPPQWTADMLVNKGVIKEGGLIAKWLNEQGEIKSDIWSKIYDALIEIGIDKDLMITS